MSKSDHLDQPDGFDPPRPRFLFDQPAPGADAGDGPDRSARPVAGAIRPSERIQSGRRGRCSSDSQSIAGRAGAPGEPVGPDIAVGPKSINAPCKSDDLSTSSPTRLICCRCYAGRRFCSPPTCATGTPPPCRAGVSRSSAC